MTSASSSSSSAEVKRKTLSIDDKLNIIKLYDGKIGVFNKQQIADQLRLPSSSLRTIMKNRKEIEINAFSGSTKRQKVRNDKNEQLENILLEWFRQARTLNLAVNGPVLTEKSVVDIAYYAIPHNTQFYDFPYESVLTRFYCICKII